jgi:hypothetical protein
MGEVWLTPEAKVGLRFDESWVMARLAQRH